MPSRSLSTRLVIFRQKLDGVTPRALARFVARARKAAGLEGAVNIVVSNDRELRSLNRRYRGKDRTTDVLSVPAATSTGAAKFAGDVILSAQEAARNARRLGHPVAAEIKVLILHGVLHLAGYDHERDRGRMARIEDRLRRRLHLPITLIARARPRASHRP